jgi:hypothetical protein
MVTWSFVVLTVTGIVLYIVPQGRIAYWTLWSFLGLNKEQWGDVHIMFGGIFIATGIWHLYFNWAPFKKYLLERARGHIQVKQELVSSLALSAVIVALSMLDLPPAGWVFQLNDAIKDSWVSAPEHEPPFGHAEEVSLAGLAQRLGLDLDQGIAALSAQGVKVDGPTDSLEHIARVNDTTPMALFAVFGSQKTPDATPLGNESEMLTPEAVEARYAGSGLGRKTLKTIFDEIGMDAAFGLSRLDSVGIRAQVDEKAKEIAERHELTPIDLMKVLVVYDFRPGRS